MQNNSPMQKIANANLPRFVADTTLVKEKQQALRDVVHGKEYKNDLGFVGFIFKPVGRSLVPNQRAARVAAVFGKELVLAGVPVYFAPLAEFLREVRLLDYSADREPISPVLSHIGKGYLILADFDDVSSQPSSSVWHDGLSMLQSHSIRGGGLVLACGYSNEPCATTATFAATAEGFRVQEV